MFQSPPSSGIILNIGKQHQLTRFNFLHHLQDFFRLGWWNSQYDGKIIQNIPNHQPVSVCGHVEVGVFSGGKQKTHGFPHRRVGELTEGISWAGDESTPKTIFLGNDHPFLRAILSHTQILTHLEKNKLKCIRTVPGWEFRTVPATGSTVCHPKRTPPNHHACPGAPVPCLRTTRAKTLDISQCNAWNFTSNPEPPQLGDVFGFLSWEYLDGLLYL